MLKSNSGLHPRADRCRASASANPRSARVRAASRSSEVGAGRSRRDRKPIFRRTAGPRRPRPGRQVELGASTTLLAAATCQGKQRGESRRYTGRDHANLLDRPRMRPGTRRAEAGQQTWSSWDHDPRTDGAHQPTRLFGPMCTAWVAGVCAVHAHPSRSVPNTS